MADTHFPDEWLAHSSGRRHAGALGGAAGEGSTTGAAWRRWSPRRSRATSRSSRLLSTRFRLKLADLAQLDPAAKGAGPRAGGAPLPSSCRSRHGLLLDWRRRTRSTSTRRRPSHSPPPVRSGCFCSRRQDRGAAGRSCTVREGRRQAARGMETSTSLEHLQDMAARRARRFRGRGEASARWCGSWT